MIDHVKGYKILNGKYGKFIRVETDEDFFNICLDPEIKEKLNKDNITERIFENIYKIFKLKHEIKHLREENKNLLE